MQQYTFNIVHKSTQGTLNCIVAQENDSYKSMEEAHQGWGVWNRGNTSCTHRLCRHARLVHLTTVSELETDKQQNSFGLHYFKGINVSPSSYDEYMA